MSLNFLLFGGLTAEAAAAIHSLWVNESRPAHELRSNIHSLVETPAFHLKKRVCAAWPPRIA